MKKSRHRRTPAHKVSERQRAKAISALSRIVDSAAQPYVVAKAAAALLNTSARDEDLPERDDGPLKTVFLPRKVPLPGQREGESKVEWNDRIRVKSEARRAAYCEHIGEAYDPMRALPSIPWPVPGTNPIWRPRSTAGSTKPKPPRSPASAPTRAQTPSRFSALGRAPTSCSTTPRRRKAAPTVIVGRPRPRRRSNEHPSNPTHQIGAGVYACTGAVQIARTTTPVPDAALALRNAGAPDTDTIIVDCGNVSILPATIGWILNFRHTGRREEFLKELVGISPATR